MKIVHPISLDEDVDLDALQRRLASELVLETEQTFSTVCGLDVAYSDDHAFAAAVVVDVTDDAFPIVDQVVVRVDDLQPYQPGRFALREASALIETLEALDSTPDLLMVDAHGTAHPRGFGLACLIGYIFDHPTIGCAKNRLFGEHGALETERGSVAAIVNGSDVTIGAALRTVDGVNPVFVSPGHRIDLDLAVEMTLLSSSEYRIPEPLRAAHQAAEAANRND